VLMNKAIMFIMGYGLLVILRREDWNELTGHPKDRGKDNSNLSGLGFWAYIYMLIASRKDSC
jgi:hypothetical protein